MCPKCKSFRTKIVKQRLNILWSKCTDCGHVYKYTRRNAD